MPKPPDHVLAGMSEADHAEASIPARYSALTRAGRAKAREAYAARQGGVCWYCKADLAGPVRENIAALPINWSLFPGERSFLKHHVHLHHCHKTDWTIGAVHAYCNAVLWQYHKE